MDTYNIRIDYLHFLGMIRKKFEQRNVWDRVVVEPSEGNDNYQTCIKLDLYPKEKAEADIFQLKEKQWLEDYHVEIEGIHPYPDHYELRLRIH